MQLLLVLLVFLILPLVLGFLACMVVVVLFFEGSVVAFALSLVTGSIVLVVSLRGLIDEIILSYFAFVSQLVERSWNFISGMVS